MQSLWKKKKRHSPQVNDALLDNLVDDPESAGISDCIV